MKIKYSHVTNSSSASFIIADTTGKAETIRVKIVVSYDLLNLSSEINISNFDDYGIDGEEAERCKDIIKSGGKIYEVTADSVGGIEEMVLCNNGLDQENIETKGVIVIRGEGGY